jgi:hypothetical protein
MDSVEQRNRMHDGKDFVIHIRSQTPDFQVQIHLGRGMKHQSHPSFRSREYTHKEATLSTNAADAEIDVGLR